jgi:hypothetical protein
MPERLIEYQAVMVKLTELNQRRSVIYIHDFAWFMSVFSPNRRAGIYHNIEAKALKLVFKPPLI